MVKYVDGKICLEALEIEDIIDIDILQDFLDNFALGMNCAAVSVDLNGKEVERCETLNDVVEKMQLKF